ARSDHVGSSLPRWATSRVYSSGSRALCRLSSESPPVPRCLRSFPTRRSSDLFVSGSVGRSWRGDDTPLVPLSDRARNELSGGVRSEEHTSELQSHLKLVCRLLLEKKKTRTHMVTKDTTLKQPYSKSTTRAMYA